MNPLEIVVWDSVAEKVVLLRRELRGMVAETARGPFSLRVEMGSLDEVWFKVDAEIRSRRPPECSFPPSAEGCDAVVVPLNWVGSCRRFKEFCESSWKITNYGTLQELESSISKGIDAAFEKHADANGLGRKFMWNGSSFAVRVGLRPNLLLLFVVTHDHDADVGDSNPDVALNSMRGVLKLLKQLPVRVSRLFVPPIGADPWNRLPLTDFATQFCKALGEEKTSFALNYGSSDMSNRWVRAPKVIQRN